MGYNYMHIPNSAYNHVYLSFSESSSYGINIIP